MKRFSFLLILPLLTAASAVLAQGPLAPSAGPAPFMKSLDQIEPRTPISSLPFRINRSGSYYFTQNLEATPETFARTSIGAAIEITADGVTLDLNGFTLSATAGVTGKSGILVAEAPAGDGHSVRISNGFIRGTTTVTPAGAFPSRVWTVTPGGFQHGLNAEWARASEFSRLTITGSRSRGLMAGRLSRIHQVTVERNGLDGIYTNQRAQVSQCVATLNGGAGIRVDGGIFTDCHAAENGGVGFYCVAGSNLSRCVSRDNLSHGFFTTNASLSHSSAHGNGENGINDGAVIAFCVALNNNLRNNASEQIFGNGRMGNHPAP